MSVSSITELPQKSGTETIEGREYIRKFHVFTDDITDDQYTIFSILGTEVTGVTIPKPGKEHPSDDSVTVRSVRPVQNPEKRSMWDVLVTYRTRDVSSPGTGEEQVLPTELPPRVSFGHRLYSRELDRAYQAGDNAGEPSKAVRNSAGDPFDPQPMHDVSHMIINIARNETMDEFSSEQTVKKYKNTLNSVAITIGGVSIGIHEGKMVKVAGDKRWDYEGNPYYEVTYEIEVADETHLGYLLDRGFYQKIGDNDHRRVLESDIGTVVSGKDRPVSEPVLLDGAGLILADDDPAGPQWQQFQPLYALSWAMLDLPVSE